jgi:hypothetical protein
VNREIPVSRWVLLIPPLATASRARAFSDGVYTRATFSLFWSLAGAGIGTGVGAGVLATVDSRMTCCVFWLLESDSGPTLRRARHTQFLMVAGSTPNSRAASCGPTSWLRETAFAFSSADSLLDLLASTL